MFFFCLLFVVAEDVFYSLRRIQHPTIGITTIIRSYSEWKTPFSCSVLEQDLYRQFVSLLAASTLIDGLPTPYIYAPLRKTPQCNRNPKLISSACKGDITTHFFS